MYARQDEQSFEASQDASQQMKHFVRRMYGNEGWAQYRYGTYRY